MDHRYTVAELFCGCGGFSHGFHLNGKFDVVFGNDVKGPALATFRANHKTPRGAPIVINRDIRSVSIDEIERALSERDVGKGELDCLIGGPPCQGFSQMRRSEEREASGIVKFSGYDRLAHDPRNDLVLRFLEIAHALQPKVIVIENVPQMLRHHYNGSLGGLTDTILSMLRDEMGYSVDIDILNSANYGVPQLRERLIILASRLTKASLPPETHEEVPQSSEKHRWVNVEDAIADLPTPPLSLDEYGGGSLDLYNKSASAYAKALHSDYSFPHNHVRLLYSPRILGIITEMRPGYTWDDESARMRNVYHGLVEAERRPHESSDATRKRLIRDGRINVAFFKDYYWSAYTRLDWARPALTITANANFLGSGRFTHPLEDRGITMREAARLQSFEDDYKFITSEDNLLETTRIGVGMDMIGEAVPPLLGKAIADHIVHLLEADEPRARPRRKSDLFGLAVPQA